MQLDINEIQTWLSGRGKAAKGKVLENLLNGAGAEGQDPSAKPKPKDVLKGLLKDLGR